MNPQCQNCGRFVSIGKGVTTEIDVAKGMVDKGHPEHIDLWGECGDKIEKIQTFSWYAGHRIV